MNKEHPVKRFRVTKGLGRLELAIAAGVPYARVYEAECGLAGSLHPSLSLTMIRFGYEGDPSSDYREWRRALGRDIAAEMQGGNRDGR